MDDKIGLHGQNMHVYIHTQSYLHIPTLVETNHPQPSTYTCPHTSHVHADICTCICLQAFRCTSSCANHVTCMSVHERAQTCVGMFPYLRAGPKARRRTHMHARTHPEDSNTVTSTSIFRLAIYILRAWDLPTVGGSMLQLTFGTPARLMRTSLS